MDTPKRRENTFRIDFGHFPKKPNAREIHAFVGKRLGLTQPQVKRIQYHQTLGCAYVQCADLNTAQQIARNHADKHEVTIENKKHTYKIRLEEAGTEVRIYELSPHISDEQISNHMSQYGEILSIKELLWDDRFMFSGTPSGIRLLKMVLTKHIESYVTIMGETSLVTYSGQIQTCRHCGERIHIGIPCTQNKKLLVQKMNINKQTSSYAAAVKNKNNKDTNTTPSLPPPTLPPASSADTPVLPIVTTSTPATPVLTTTVTPSSPSLPIVTPSNSTSLDLPTVTPSTSAASSTVAADDPADVEKQQSSSDESESENDSLIPNGTDVSSFKPPEQPDKHKLDDSNSDSNTDTSKGKPGQRKKPKKKKSLDGTNTPKP